MQTLRVGSRIRLTWESSNGRDVNEAREFFSRQTRQGWLAARRNSEYKRVLEFNPEHGELWFIPLSEGG
jgi:hypothetical protein